MSTVGRRSFPVAAATLWTTLPVDVQSSPSLPVFCQRLKTFLFHKSFLDVRYNTYQETQIRNALTADEQNARRQRPVHTTVTDCNF